MTYTKRPKQFVVEKRTRFDKHFTFITYVKSRFNRRKKHVMRRSRQYQERKARLNAEWRQEMAQQAADRQVQQGAYLLADWTPRYIDTTYTFESSHES